MNQISGRSYHFSHAIVREPASSVVNGLRAGDGDNPDALQFKREHAGYVVALQRAGVEVFSLPALEEFPDSVFVEDPALVLARTAIVLRPGASSRLGEAAALKEHLQDQLPNVLDLPGAGFVDGGDLLATDTELFVGLSARTDSAGIAALTPLVENLGYRVCVVQTPPSILHFKTACGLLDSETIFCTEALAETGCFKNYSTVLAPKGEEAAANLVRINDTVFINSGFPDSTKLLGNMGYKITELPLHEAAKIDGGLSCLSLRFGL